MIGHSRGTHWGRIALAAALGITVYWTVVSLAALVDARDAAGWNVSSEMPYWVVGLLIYFVRLQVTVWVFQKRKWTWLETTTITVLMSFVLYAFANMGGNNKQVVGIVEVIGILLYLLGSYINTHSEYFRHVWKLKEENRGRLYTERLFRYPPRPTHFIFPD